MWHGLPHHDIIGEDVLVMMLGALHIEDKVLPITGKILKDSGWTHIITRAKVLTSGTAESSLDEDHIKRSRYAHQVSVMGLYILKLRSYKAYCLGVNGPPESFELWASRRKTQSPMFMFWCTVMDFELL